MSKLIVTPEFESGMERVRDGRHVFITGRAGTGKSTLLSMIRQLDLGRASAVVAPTGVAALNVEGETIHSFFAFRPSLSPDLREYRAPLRLGDIDMLIVEEISMARADLVDMMDTALRRRRRSGEPFGGVQMVLVGDLYQLPPVVTEHEAEPVLGGYSSPYFFAARVFRRFEFDTIELGHVFRQRDERFIHLLNAIRDGSATEADLEALNRRVEPEVAAHPPAGAITLTTTNRSADAVNRAMLEQLDRPVFTSTAVIAGEFDASQYKVERELSIAVGAQVMMLVNTGAYVNGSLGRVVEVARDGGGFRVAIELPQSGTTVVVGPHRWEITRPDRQDGRVRTAVVGTYTQLPFRLAWAVTVHKSQGKTFDRVVFDRGRRVFAPGQLYVALSRCTSLQGLTLKHPLRPRDVLTDPEVTRFHRRATARQVPQSEVLRSFVGSVGTGGGEFNKLVELAVIRETPTGGHVAVTTLVNPLRDVTEAAEAGIVAADVAIAPTVAELRPALAALLEGTVLVTHGLAELHRLVGWDKDGIGEGLGIDLRDHDVAFEIEARSSALDRASAILEAARAIEGKALPVTPLRSGGTQPGPGCYLLPRDGHPQQARLAAFIKAMPVDADVRLRLLLGLAPGARDGLTELAVQVRAFIAEQRIPEAVLDGGAAALVERLVTAAGRNALFTAGEVAVVESVAAALGVPVDRSRLTAATGTVELAPGTRVCFTGSPPSGPEHAHLSKDSLRKAAAAAGLEETASVTKSRCDLVVAFDPSSMSGKAKKARTLGKPVLGADDFLRSLQALPDQRH